jgi:hypothetical protein
VVAAVTGALVGLLGVVATYLGLRGCEVVRGTESCGGGPGLLLLLVIVVLMAFAGAAVLAAWRVPEARSTSVLGVGVTVVVVLLALTPVVFSHWMVVVIPLVGAAAFLLASWVTTTFVERTPEPGPEVDVR